MAGVRKDGILQVNTSGGGPGTAVDITAPLGQQLMADSVSVTLASDQTIVFVSDSNLDVPLSGPATDLTEINAKFGTLGQKVMAGSAPVVIASNQSAIQVTISSGTITTITNVVHVDDNGGSLTVDANNLDIRDLVFATDKVDITGSVVTSLTFDGFGTAINGRSADPEPGVRGLVVRLPAGANVIGGVTQSGNWPVRLQDGSGNPLESTTSPVGGRGLNIHTGFGDGAAYSGAEPVFPIVGFYNGATQYRIPFVADATPGITDTALVIRQVGMPSAVALADNTANPTLTQIETFPMAYDGVTWDRQRGDSINGLLVNLGTNNDVTITGIATITATDLDIRNLDDDTDSVAISALVSDNPSSYIPDTLQNLSLTSEGLLRTENTVSRESLIWSNLDSNPFKQEDCGW